GMLASVSALEPGAGPAGIAAGRIVVGVIGVAAVVRTAEWRGCDGAGRSDRGSCNAGRRTYGAAGHIGSRADRTTMVVIAAMGVAVIPRHGGCGQGGENDRGSSSELQALHKLSPGLMTVLNLTRKMKVPCARVIRGERDAGFRSRFGQLNRND